MRKRLFSGRAGVCALLCAVFGFSAPADAQPLTEAAAPISASAPAQVTDRLVFDPAVLRGELPNGLKYGLMRNGVPSRGLSLRLHVNAGSFEEYDDEQGLMHFLEHMAFNGSTNFAEGELVKTLERFGLRFGADTNAFTGRTEVVYQLDLPDAQNEEALATAILILSDIAGRLTLDDTAILREHGVVSAEARQRRDGGFQREQKRNAFMFKGTALVDRPPIGLGDIAQRATRERLLALYQRVYRPDNLTLVGVGDVDPEQIRVLIEKNFSAFLRPEAPFAPRALASFQPTTKLTANSIADEDLATSILIDGNRPFVDEPDTIETRRAATLRTIANAIVSERLGRMARAPGAVILGGAASYGETRPLVIGPSITVRAQPDLWREAARVANEEWRRALLHGFQPNEVDAQIASLRLATQQATKAASTRRSEGLASALLARLVNDDVFTHPSQSEAIFEAHIAPAITPSAVHAAFRAQWEGLKPQLWLQSSKPIKQGGDAVLAAFRAADTTEVTPADDLDIQDFAYGDLGQPGAILDRKTIEPESITQITFANGLRLALKPTQFQKGRVVVSIGLLDGGVFDDPAPPEGLAVLVNGAFIRGGLGQHSLDQLAQMHPGRAVLPNFLMGLDGHSFGGAPASEDVERLLEIIAAYITDPAYNRVAVTQFRNEFSGAYQRFDASPSGVFGAEAVRWLRGGDRAFGIPALETTLAHDFETAKPFLETAFRGPIVMSLVGDFEIEETIATVARTLGALPGERPAPEHQRVRRPGAFPVGQMLELKHSGIAGRALVSLAWPAPDGTERQRNAKLAALAGILRLRVTERIRETEGESYSPSVFRYGDDVVLDYGAIGVQVEGDPNRIDSLIAHIQAVAADMVARAPTDDELQRYRAPLLQNFRQSLEANGLWAGLGLALWTRPDSLAGFREREAEVLAITPAQINDLARSIFIPEKVATVIIRGGKKS